MKRAALVVAAGASTRLGQPKQLVQILGETLLDRAVRTAAEAGLGPVVVVLGANAKEVAEQCDLRRAWVVVHAGWAEGMGTSIRAGAELLEGFPDLDGAVVMTCDMPGVTPEHLRALCVAPDQLRASEYGGRRGVPAYFPQSHFALLRELDGDAGAREMLRGADAVTLAEGEMDVDTAADLARVRSAFQKRVN